MYLKCIKKSKIKYTYTECPKISTPHPRNLENYTRYAKNNNQLF